MKGLLLRGFGAFALVNLLLLYVPPSVPSLAIIGLIGAAALLLDPRNLLPLAVSLAMLTLILEGVVRIGGLGVSTYYRPHEMLALESSYEPNRIVEMDVPHGDLLTIDPKLSRDLAEPRHELFASDSEGNRNSANYSGERLILVGDSFLVGTATTLAQELQHLYGIRAYNVSFSGSGPLLYAERIQWVRSTLASPSCVVLFYFEGNDFRFTNAADVATRENIPSGLQNAVRGYVRTLRRSSEWSRMFYGLLTRSLAILTRPAPSPAGTADGPTFVRSVAGRPMAFLSGYAEVTRRPAFDDHGYVAARLSAAPPDMVAFIPDKYRVYAPLLDASQEYELPSAQWQYLQQAASRIGVETLDLTPHLVARSRELLPSGRTTFWRDDTHWNKLGEDAAAEALLEALKRSPRTTCREQALHETAVQ